VAHRNEIAGRAPVPVDQFHRWGIATSVALGVLAFVLILGIDFLTADLHDRDVLDRGLPVASTELRLNHARLGFIARLFATIQVLTIPLFLVWQYRAHASLRALGPSGLRFAPGLAVGSWLIPGANLALPCLAMRELWKASDHEAGPADWRRRRTTPLVWLWWLGFLSMAALAVAALLSSPASGATHHELIVRNWLGMAAAGTGVLTAVLAIVLIVRIDGRLALKEEQFVSPYWESWANP
jgi:hypothetical protein